MNVYTQSKSLDMFWWIVLIISTVTFFSRIKIEEDLMSIEFPDQYPEYKKLTKALKLLFFKICVV